MASEYYVGGDDIIGDDDELEGIFEGDDDDDDEFGIDVIGADKKKKATTLSKLLKLMNAQNVPTGRKIVRNNLKIMRLQVLPLPVTSITTLDTEDIQAAPQRDIRVERLVVPSFCAEYFTITQFSVGQENQFVAAGEISAQTYSEVAVGVRLQGNTANVGNRINLSIKNIDAATQVFYGSIHGTVLTNG